MTVFSLKPLTIAATLAVFASPLAAQQMSSAQCDQMMMVGTQAYTPAQVAGCTAYFQALADGAVATGTFAVVRPQTSVTLSTSGN